jgi:hypothetical protein
LINLLSLIPAPASVPAVSTNLSVETAQDFSAILTELVGAVPSPQASQLAQKPQAQPVTKLQPSAGSLTEHAGAIAPETSTTEVQLPKPENTPVAAVHDRRFYGLSPQQMSLATDQKTSGGRPPLQQRPAITHPLPDPLAVASPTETPSKPEESNPEVKPEVKPNAELDVASKAPSETPAVQPDVPVMHTAIVAAAAHAAVDSIEPLDPAKPPVAETPVPQLNHAPSAPPDPHAILEDLKKIEFTVDHEVLKPAEILQKPERPIQPIITTDPIANIQQPQLPLRVMAIQKVLTDAKPAERKNSPALETADTSSAAPSIHVPEQPRAIDAVEQPRPSQLIEVPNIPKLQVVRTVAMEVGDPQSQVIVRIEDRGHGLTVHFGTGNEALHRCIESSMGSLVHALKRENIEVSNVEVSRKSPIEKVRRMKEAH